MQVTMKDDYSDREDHPKKGESLEVENIIRDDNGDIDCYEVDYKGTLLLVYPYELVNDGEVDE